MENFKPRDRHQEPSALHRDEPDKSERDKAATAIDQGPSFGTPGDPPDADPQRIAEIEKAYPDLGHEDDATRSR